MRRLSNGGKQSRQELMRQHKEEQGRIPTGVLQVGNRHDIPRQSNAGQVFNVFVMCVDVLGQFDLLTAVFVVNHFFKDPHVDLVFVIRQALTVAADNVGNGGSPIAAANDADLFELFTAGLRIAIHHVRFVIVI